MKNLYRVILMVGILASLAVAFKGDSHGCKEKGFVTGIVLAPKITARGEITGGVPIPLPNARIFVKAPSGKIQTTFSDRFGRFSLAFDPGQVQIDIQHPSYGPVRLAGNVQAGGIFQAGGNQGYIVMQKPGREQPVLSARLSVRQSENIPPNLVRVHLQATNAKGLPLPNLKGEDLSVTVEGNQVPFRVTPVNLAGTPMSVSIVLDRSGSMSYNPDTLPNLKEAASTFVSYMGPEDRAEVVNFDNRVSRSAPFTQDKAALKKAVSQNGWGGGTALYDAVWDAVADLRLERSPRKAVLVVTDGQETNSRHKDLATLIAYAKENGVQVYTVGLNLKEQGRAEKNLQALAGGTGGLYYRAPKGNELKQVYSAIAAQMKREYLLEYRAPQGSPPADIRLTGLKAREAQALSSRGVR